MRLFLCFCIFVLLVMYIWKRRKLYLFSWKCEGPFAWPIVGNLFWLPLTAEGVPSKLEEFQTKYSSSMRIWIGNALYYLVKSPDDWSVVLHSSKSLDKGNLFGKSFMVIGEGLVNAPVQKWRINRKILVPSFNRNIINSYIPIFQDHCKKLMSDLDQHVGQGEFDCFMSVHQYTLNILCETAMGIKMEAEEDGVKIISSMERMKEIGVQRFLTLRYWLDFIFIRTSIGEEAINTVQIIHGFAQKVLNNRRHEMNERQRNLFKEADVDTEAESSRRTYFVDHLLELSDQGAVFSDQDCIYEITTFIFAGSDTSAITVSFALMMLGMHPHIQDKVFLEICEVFPEGEGPITIADLSKLKYLERVIKETMRLFPIGLIMGRYCTEDLNLGSVTVPSGVCIIVDLLNLHRSSKYWPNPLKFDPDRFLPEEVAKRHPRVYLPFSGGPRNCIGIRFAMISMKIVLSKILRTYKFKTRFRKVEDIKLGMHVLIKAINGHMVEVERRSEC